MDSFVRLLGIALALGTIAAPAAAQRCEAPEVMIVVDRSSSMAASRSGLLASGLSKWGAAREGIANLTSRFAGGVDFGVAIYPPVDRANTCDPGRVAVTVGPHGAEEIMGVVPEEDPPYAGNWTATAQTLDAILEGGFALETTTRERHVVLITDGEQCCYDGGDVCLPEQRFWPVDSVLRLREAGIVTHVIGFGSLVDALTLNRAAVAAGTALPGCVMDGTDPASPDNCYYQVNELADLEAALDAIARSVTDETCDGFDNDCDNVIDNGYDRDADGFTLCGSDPTMPGVPPTRTRADCVDVDPAVHPGALEVCNGLDDDCDGAIDPGCECNVGETRACGSDVGLCELGAQTCVMGAWSACDGAVDASVEVCDGLDQNCDGSVDENAPCDPGSVCHDGACRPVAMQDSGCTCSSVGSDELPAFLGLSMIVLAFLRRRRPAR
jgi:MYXO-CTERM domain-containing protein